MRFRDVLPTHLCHLQMESWSCRGSQVKYRCTFKHLHYPHVTMTAAFSCFVIRNICSAKEQWGFGIVLLETWGSWGWHYFFTVIAGMMDIACESNSRWTFVYLWNRGHWWHVRVASRCRSWSEGAPLAISWLSLMSDELFMTWLAVYLSLPNISMC